MAVVRITDQLKSSIANKVRALYNDRIVASQVFPDIDTWGPKLYDLAFGQYVAAMEALPRSFFAGGTEFSFRGWINGIAGVSDTGLDFPMPREIIIPVGGRGREHMAECGLMTDGNMTFYFNAEDPRWDEFKDVYIKHMNDRKAATNERHAAGVAAIQLLDRFVTLAPALKEWPALWDLLDETTKDTHRKVREPKKPKPKIIVPTADKSAPIPDMSGVTAILAQNKIMKGGNQ